MFMPLPMFMPKSCFIPPIMGQSIDPPPIPCIGICIPCIRMPCIGIAASGAGAA